MHSNCGGASGVATVFLTPRQQQQKEQYKQQCKLQYKRYHHQQQQVLALDPLSIGGSAVGLRQLATPA